MVITGRTRNAFALPGTRVRIPPSPPKEKRYPKDAFFLLYEEGFEPTGVNDSPVDCQSRRKAFPQKSESLRLRRNIYSESGSLKKLLNFTWKYIIIKT